MKTIFTTKYGTPEVLELREAIKPIPKTNEVLVKIIASSVTAADSMMRKGEPYFGRLFVGLTKPKNPIPGTGFAGTIETMGDEVKSFEIGEEVFGEIVLGPGTNCEYVCVPENGLILKKPPKISFEEAAVVCDGALTSINFLKKIARLTKGQKVLINGASGSLGIAAVQIAKIYGAHVTGVCSAKNFDFVMSFGADHIIDYHTKKFTKEATLYDIIYDTVGSLSYSNCKKVLKKDGIFMSPVLNMPLLTQVLKTSIFGLKKAKFSATGLQPIKELKPLFIELKTLLEQGSLIMPIERSYALDDIVNAHLHVDSGRKKGNIVLDHRL